MLVSIVEFIFFAFRVMNVVLKNRQQVFIFSAIVFMSKTRTYAQQNFKAFKNFNFFSVLFHCLSKSLIRIVVLRPYFFDDQNVLGSSAPILCNFFCFLRSECITKAKNGSFIVAVVFYEDPFGLKDAIIHKY